LKNSRRSAISFSRPEIRPCNCKKFWFAFRSG